MRLSQCLGIERKTRTRVTREVTDLYRTIRLRDYFNGFYRTYKPVNDDDAGLPPETKVVQQKVDPVLIKLRQLETELFDLVATKEWGNTKARADVVVDGTVILPDVPVTFLLFLEKQLTDLHQFFRELPVLDPSEVWEFDHGDGFYKSEPSETQKMKKVPRTLQLVAATEHHPAQVETYNEDMLIGTWTRISVSGAVYPSRVEELCRKAIILRNAVVSAREAANVIEVEPQTVGKAIFDYLF